MISFLTHGLKETQLKAKIAYMLYKMLLDIDIEDEFRIFAMPEYKIKPRTYESIVNSIAW